MIKTAPVKLLPGISPYSAKVSPEIVKGFEKEHPGFMRRSRVIELIGVSNSTIYTWMRKGLFPMPYRLPGDLVAWKASQVMLWVAIHDGSVNQVEAA